MEALPTLYQSTTLIFTSLGLAHALLCVTPSPHVARLMSLELSLSMRFTQLHAQHQLSHTHPQLRYQAARHARPAEGPSAGSEEGSEGGGFLAARAPPSRTASPCLTASPWPALCASLSHLAESAALQSLVLRLDVADRDDVDDGGDCDCDAASGCPSPSPAAAAVIDDRHDRFWWEVRETRALGGLSAVLRRRARVYLPELTVDVPRMRAFQFRVEPDAGAPSPPSSSSSYSPSSSFSSPLSSSALPPSHSSHHNVSCGALLVPSDFQALVRYPRRRWRREGGTVRSAGGFQGRDGVESRLEFFNPREHTPGAAMFMGGNTSDGRGRGNWGNNKMADLFRGMLIC